MKATAWHTRTLCAQPSQGQFSQSRFNPHPHVYCDLSGADFTSATLRWTNFQIANLSGAILRNADLANASLIDTNLCGADLTDAKLKWAIIKGTKYDALTKFPKGFDPKKEDMILVDAVAVAG